MTDYASQGKTRLFNPVIIQNCKDYHGIYTALSRSATAAGTVILQGFSPAKITGGIRGSLRQEYRELELLDDITRLRYNGNLHKSVYGDCRNILIKSFRTWKGQDYVPKHVHNAIRWTKSDPLQETDIEDLAWRIVKNNEDNLKVQNSHLILERLQPANGSKLIVKANSCKRARSPSIENSERECVKKQRTDEINNTVSSRMGPQWNENSCAYDVVVAILYALWQTDAPTWSIRFEGPGNDTLKSLGAAFKNILQGSGSIEDARDVLRTNLGVLDNARFKVFHKSGSYSSTCE
ncbi:hypothetical protein K435DRAFT_651879 [Dendrothele bispora CBS 962.96]|uniref:Uncharacterized protein n=1 Tax=Dendrothele bispora (strain CBS 962.96) TaxID=1314807 RepID=A0A4S8MK62_DENBC|nr:hypothetical protein K435DRAFT_651879 [Dendrothele bispora CBS 962.96]